MNRLKIGNITLVSYSSDDCEIIYHGEKKKVKQLDTSKAIPKPISNKRKYVYDRDGWACLICGSKKNLTLDHILPSSKGGSSAANNLQTLCYPCNSQKSDAYADYRKPETIINLTPNINEEI